MDERIKSLGIVLTSHPRQQMFMQQGIMSWLGFQGGDIVLAYDDIDAEMLPRPEFCPPVNHIICTGQPLGRLGHRGGELMTIKIGAEKLRDLGCEYIFKDSADTTTYRYRGFDQLFELLDKVKTDLIVLKHCVVFFGRTEAVCRAMEPVKLPDFINEPIKGTAEGWFGNYCKAAGVTEYGLNDENWWEKILGRIHVQGEYALNHQIGTRDTWKTGEIWLR